MSVNNYTLNMLYYQRERLEQLLADAKYNDEVTFYTNCLKEVNKDIDNIGKNTDILAYIEQNEDIL